MDVSLDDMIKKEGGGAGRGRGKGKGRGRGRGAVATRGRGGTTTVSRTSGSIKKPTSRGRGGGKGGGAGRGKGGKGSARAARVKESVEEPAPCLVGASTDIKSAAGYVCSQLREGAPPAVMAISPANVNQAAKLLALAHSYLEEESLDLYAQVDFPEYAASSQTASIKLHVFKKARRQDLSQVNEQIFVNATSEPPKVAGYIAKSVRDSTLGRICITAAGPQPMLRALKSIFLARHYLQDDGLDLSIVPEFGKSDDGAVSLVNIFVLSHKVGARV